MIDRYLYVESRINLQVYIHMYSWLYCGYKLTYKLAVPIDIAGPQGCI